MSQSGLYDFHGVIPGPLNTLSPDVGGAVVPNVAGNINVLGGTNINTTAGVNSIIVNLDDDVTITGFFQADGDITTTAGDIEVTLGDIDVVNGNISAGGTIIADGDVGSLAGDVNAFNDMTAGNDITATNDVFGDGIVVTGDCGGHLGTISLTNVYDFSKNETGIFVIKSKTALPLDSTGFIKIYVEGTPYWIPVFSTTSPTP